MSQLKRWLYLAVVLDLFTRKIVGWAMRDHMRAELTIAALSAPVLIPVDAAEGMAARGPEYQKADIPAGFFRGSIQVLKSAVQSAKLGREEELAALKRLDDQARLVERHASGRPVEELIAQERRLSHSYRGRSVFGWEHPPKDCADAKDMMDENAGRF